MLIRMRMEIVIEIFIIMILIIIRIILIIIIFILFGFMVVVDFFDYVVKCKWEVVDVKLVEEFVSYFRDLFFWVNKFLVLVYLWNYKFEMNKYV